MLVYCGHCGTLHRLSDKDTARDLPCRYCTKPIPLPSKVPSGPQVRLFCPRCDGRLKTPPMPPGEQLKCPYCMERIALPTLRDGTADSPPETPTADVDMADVDEEADEVEEIPGELEAVSDIEEAPADDPTTRYDIKRMLAAHAEETDRALQKTAWAVGIACLAGSGVGLLLGIPMGLLALGATQGELGPFAAVVVAIAVALFFLGRYFRDQHKAWRRLLAHFLFLVTLAVALPLLWIAFSFLAQAAGRPPAFLFSTWERAVVLIVGTGAFLGCSSLVTRARRGLFVHTRFGPESDLATSTPWEICNRIRAALDKAVVRRGALHIALAILLTALSAYLASRERFRLFSPVPLVCGLVLVCVGMNRMRFHRMILGILAEMLADRRPLRIMALRDACRTDTRTIATLLAEIQRSKVLPKRLLIPPPHTATKNDKADADTREVVATKP